MCKCFGGVLFHFHLLTTRILWVYWMTMTVIQPYFGLLLGERLCHGCEKVFLKHQEVSYGYVAVHGVKRV